MTDTSIVTQNQSIQMLESDVQAFELLQDFQRKLNFHIDETKIKRNKFAKNAKYLPIGEIEKQLDEIFSGLWQTKDFQTKVVANEIVGQIQLLVFHPIAKQWIERTGSASVQIQMKSTDNGGNGDITDIRNKIVNTLTKDYPHLLSSCISNAAQKLGRYFGRGLNRDTDYSKEGKTFPELTKIMNKENEDILIATSELQKCKTREEMQEYWNNKVPFEIKPRKEMHDVYTNQLKVIKANGQSKD